jgi:hypothetical protein
MEASEAVAAAATEGAADETQEISTAPLEQEAVLQAEPAVAAVDEVAAAPSNEQAASSEQAMPSAEETTPTTEEIAGEETPAPAEQAVPESPAEEPAAEQAVAAAPAPEELAAPALEEAAQPVSQPASAEVAEQALVEPASEISQEEQAAAEVAPEEAAPERPGGETVAPEAAAEEPETAQAVAEAPAEEPEAAQAVPEAPAEEPEAEQAAAEAPAEEPEAPAEAPVQEVEAEPALAPEAPVEEAVAAPPAWKQAAEAGDLQGALASIPGDEEHEADRHALFGDLVNKNEESDLPQALLDAAQWQERVGESLRDEVRGVRSRLYKKQIAQADKATILSALDGLKACGAAAAVVGALAIQSAKKFLDEDDFETTEQVLGSLEVDSLSEAQKEQAQGAWERLGRGHREAGREDGWRRALEALRGLGAAALVDQLEGEVKASAIQGLLDQNDFDAALAELEASSLAGEQRQGLLLAALRGQLAAAQAASDGGREQEIFTRIRQADPADPAATQYFEAQAAAEKAAAEQAAAEQAAAEEAAAAQAAAEKAAADEAAAAQAAAEQAAAEQAAAAEAAAAAQSAADEEIELPESHDEAIAKLKEILTENPKRTAAHRAAYKKFGDKANARKLIDLYRDLQKQNPDSPEFLLYLARAYCHVGKDTLAVVQFRKLLSSDPQPEVYLDLTRAYRRLKKMGDAVKTVDQALEAMPGQAAPKKEQVIILSLSEAFADAANAAKQGLELSALSDDDRAWFEKAAELSAAKSKLPDDMMESPNTF